MTRWVIPLFVLLLVPFSTVNVHSEESDKLREFQDWADSHGINLVGVNKSSWDLYYEGFDAATDTVDWKQIPKVLVVADALYQIPKDVIQVMDGKTIYFSTEYGRSYTVLGSFPDYDILTGVDRGIILEQNYNAHTVIHELGHIVDYHGIQGFYDDENHIFADSEQLKESTFQVTVEYQSGSYVIPEGYISVYSTANDAENFAENFAHYVLFADKFQERIDVDSTLQNEYDFMRDQIFQGKEFKLN